MKKARKLAEKSLLAFFIDLYKTARKNERTRMEEWILKKKRMQTTCYASV